MKIKKKFEKISDELFENEVSSKELAYLTGGNGGEKNTFDLEQTYIGKNGDVYLVEDTSDGIYIVDDGYVFY